MPILTRSILLAPWLALGLACAAQAQVHRCGDSRLYTDKPCDQARPVDLRSNVLKAGPRGMPTEPAPAPAVIPQEQPLVPPMDPSTGNVFDRREAAEADFRTRTNRP